MESPFSAGVLTISDACSRGLRVDESGDTIIAALQDSGFTIARKTVVPDEARLIAETLKSWCADCSLILTTGGTGFAPRDVTPEATMAVLERPAPGIPELLRWSGFQHTPRAALSRGVAGIRGSTLIINLPGSPRAVAEALAILVPLLPHALALLSSRPVDH